MKVDVRDLLTDAGLEKESFYPGKRLVHKYVQHGEHKSHCAVFTWNENVVRVEFKAGLTGHTPDPKTLRLYPVSFQAPTFLEIEAEETGDEEDGEARGKSGSGGKKPSRKHLKEESPSSMSAFSKMADGAVHTLGEIKKFVIMGKEIAQDSYAQAYDNLRAQLRQSKVMVLDLMKGVSNVIQKATPGGGLAPRGDETLKYSYDAEKTAPMFGGLTPT